VPPAPAPPDLAAQLARELAGCLCVLQGELLYESGPLGAEPLELAVEARRYYTRLARSYRTLREGKSDTSLQFVGRFLTHFHDRICTPLGRVELLSDRASVRATTGEIADACHTLLAELCAAFGIDRLSPRRSLGGAGEQAIVATDVVRYTTLARAQAARGLSQGCLGEAECVAELNLLVADLIRAALPTPDWTSNVIRSAGDGFTLRFPTMRAAVAFADNLHGVPQGGLPGLDERIVHRVGVAWGYVHLEVRAETSSRLVETAGLPFIEAARMEAGCKPGEVAIHQQAWWRWLKELGLPSTARPSQHPALAGFVDRTQPGSELEVKEELYPAWVRGPE
jgi:class 3 adenylate cyclase